VDFVNPTFRKTKRTEQYAWTCMNACFSYDEMACDRHIVATVSRLETVLETFLKQGAWDGTYMMLHLSDPHVLVHTMIVHPSCVR